jgi:hypothetical protein
MVWPLYILTPCVSAACLAKAWSTSNVLLLHPLPSRYFEPLIHHTQPRHEAPAQPLQTPVLIPYHWPHERFEDDVLAANGTPWAPALAGLLPAAHALQPYSQLRLLHTQKPFILITGPGTQPLLIPLHFVYHWP